VDAQLDEILRDLLEVKGDRVTFEWVSEGIEVTFYRGSTGMGSVIPRPRAGSLMEEVASRMRRAERAGGHLKVDVGGRQVRFVTKEYDYFGEAAFELAVQR
jgi:hypothetical protein